MSKYKTTPGTIFVDDSNWWKWWRWRFVTPASERAEYGRRAFESLKPETQEQLRKEYGCDDDVNPWAH